MSERVISDPTVAGWELNPDTGYWMWAAGGGSIQDGDTEGQITTWDGTEWTPEGAVVVDSSHINAVGGKYSQMRITRSGALSDNSVSGVVFNNDVTTNGVGITGGFEQGFKFFTTTNSTGDQPLDQSARDELMTIDADGNVNITGKLFINGDEVTAGGGGGGFWVEESPGVIKYTGTAKATDLVAG
jgi:hypothetical protein